MVNISSFVDKLVLVVTAQSCDFSTGSQTTQSQMDRGVCQKNYL